MSIEGFTRQFSPQGFAVYPAEAFRVTIGANRGDALDLASEMILDDLYLLNPNAQPATLAFDPLNAASHYEIRDDSRVGTPGATLHLDCCAVFMAPDGDTVEALVLVELEPDSDLIAQIYMMPLSPLKHRVDYALVDIDVDGARQRFARLACVSFARGTRITMACGAQKPIEDIVPGDAVLTRDGGAQPVRWIGQTCLRANGAFAPIVFAPGTVNNAETLRLSPNQRLFFYQREDRLGAGQAEVVVRADLLVNGDTICPVPGGFVDYFQLLLDTHQFVFAEGIAAESLTVDARTQAALPEPMRGADHPSTDGPAGPDPFEMTAGMLDGAVAAQVLRHASIS